MHNACKNKSSLFQLQSAASVNLANFHNDWFLQGSVSKSVWSSFDVRQCKYNKFVVITNTKLTCKELIKKS